MNESMLHSLMHLFAIIASINPDTIFSLARDFVESYLNQQLSKKLAEKYLAVYEYYFNEIEAPESKARSKGTSSLTDKMMAICGEINKELHIKNRFQILLSLLQFNKYFETYAGDESGFTQSVSDTVRTISDGLTIKPAEYENCQAFVTDKFYKVPDKNRLMVISGDSTFSFTEIRHMHMKGLKGQIFVLQIKRADIYLFHYLGADNLELNGKYIFPRHVYFLPKGLSIKSRQAGPLYYSDITSHFFRDDAKEQIDYLAKDIEFMFKNSDNGIQRFTFYGKSGQLVGIMGGSGTGKSTLLRILNGILTVDHGKIYINGNDLYSDIPGLEGMIGYIPQDDLLLEELTVYQNLYFNARLCLDNFSDEEIRQRTSNLLAGLDLFEVKGLKVGSPLTKFISGGQRKRLNIALELIREPSVLFVDEPTSGLSSTDSENVMFLLKEQAARGKLVAVNIHQPSSELFKMFDRLLILDKGGYPVFFGDPVEAIIYFKKITDRVDAGESECPVCGNTNPEEILQIIEAKDVNEMGEFTNKRKIQPVEWYRMYLNNIQSKLKFDSVREKLPANPFKKPGFLKQFSIFSRRNLLAKFADRQYLLIALLVAPVLAVILGFLTKYVSGSESNIHEYIFSRNENLPAYLFMSVIVALFLGMIISAEEIIKDRRILVRESFLNLSRASYLLAKVSFLFSLSAIQMIVYVLCGNSILEIRGMTFNYWIILFSAACFANLLGLNISDGLKSVVAIYIVVPLLLVPQILLAGVIVKFDKLHYSVAAYENVPVAGDLMASRWAYEALAVNQFRNNKYQKHFFAVEQAESNVSYELYHLIPAILEKINDTERYLQSEPKDPRIRQNFKLILNGVQDIRSNPMKDLKDLSIETMNIRLLQHIKNQLQNLRYVLSGKRDKLVYQKDTLQIELIKKLGSGEELIRLKHDHDNEKLDDLVLNRNELHKIVESGSRFIRKMDPVYQIPSSGNGRAQFFSAVKILGNYQINTIWFNVIVIWIMTLVLYIALQFSWLRKMIELFGKSG
jgi:ABC-type multidrug transport system ATPase subunit